ncbi:MAG TPA: hypothetical protein VF008_29125 [Niastella sp.]
MATKNQIIEEFYRSKEFNDCIGKMEPDHLRDDLRAEVVLILLETNTDKLLAIHDAGALRYYAVRIIINLIQSKTSLFYKKYRQQFTPIGIRQDYSGNTYVDEMIKIGKSFDKMTMDFQLTQEEDHKEREAREDAEERAMREIDNLYWYNAGIVKLYLKHGNYRAIEEDTGIPYSSAYKTVQKSFQEIREKVLR